MTAKQSSKGKNVADSADDKKKGQSEQSKSNSTSGAHEDEGQELDALLKLLNDEDAVDMDMEAATEMIDHWQTTLQQSEEPEMQAIGETLKHLKKSLTGKKPKENEITELLSQVGSQVDDFATSAKRGYKTKLHTLGKTLKQISEELKEDEE
jgi:hypothetical protein